MDGLPSAATVYVPYKDDLLMVVSERLVQRFAGRLADLGNVVILLPDADCCRYLQQTLEQKTAALGSELEVRPYIGTLRAWTEAQDQSLALLDAHAQELLLTETLLHHTGLLNGGSPWHSSAVLLELFKDLTLHRVQLPDTVEAFIKQLKASYRIAGGTFAALSREAQLIHTLWRAWHTELGADHRLDEHAAYLLRLAYTRRNLHPAQFFYFAGLDDLDGASLQWATAVSGQGQGEFIRYAPVSAQQIFYGQAPASYDAYAACLHAVYDATETLAVRARAFAKRHETSPLRGRLTLGQCRNSEHEAQVIAAQTHAWLNEGRRSIAIVTEDRRLARRLHALFRRSEFKIHDSTGWPLSTTRAATVLERWLQIIEDDFGEQALLDFLRSPYSVDAQAEHLHSVNIFERDIVRRDNVTRGLARYRVRLRYRQARQAEWSGACGDYMLALLNKLQLAAQPLMKLRSTRRQSARAWLEALDQSLTLSGVNQRLIADAAGLAVTQELQSMHGALAGRTLRMHWAEWRAWLTRCLERRQIRAEENDPSPLQLLTLQHSSLQRYEGVIIAGADSGHLPGAKMETPFFNHSIRHELGLPTWQQAHALRLSRFRRLLEAAPEVIITSSLKQDTESGMTSPWVVLLQAFHRLAYGDDLTYTELDHYRGPASGDVVSDSADLPLPQRYPRPAAAPELIPKVLTVSAHQRLIDCPYRFFAADCLALKPMDESRAQMQKSDYGMHVHRCLQAFHHGVDHLPGPFPAEQLQAHDRNAAIDLMTTITHAVFAEDLADNFIHRGWLQRWLMLIPRYVDWQIERARDWRVVSVEQQRTCRLDTELHLQGRIDRIDSGTEGFAVIDYKTGMTPQKPAVMSGEDVQLLSYALLQDDVRRIDYVKLDAEKVASAVCVDGDDLTALKGQVRSRCVDVMRQVRAGAPLPAWGDAKTCLHCDWRGICRRGMWQDDGGSG